MTSPASARRRFGGLALGVVVVLGACQSDKVDEPLIACLDEVVPTDPGGLGGEPDLCGLGGGACFTRVTSLAFKSSHTGGVNHANGEHGLAIAVSWSPVDDVVLLGAINELRLLRVDVANGAITELLSIYQTARAHVAWSPDGKYALAATDELRLYSVPRDPPLFVEVARVAPGAQPMTSVFWSPDGTKAITTSLDGKVRLFSVAPAEGQMSLIGTFEGSHGKAYNSSWSPDGTKVVITGQDGTARLLQVDAAAGTLTEVSTLSFASEVDPVSFSPRGDLMIGTWVPCQSKVELVSLDPTGAFSVTGEITNTESGATSLSWWRDGSYALIGGHDDTIRFVGRHGNSMRVLGVLPKDGMGVHSTSWSTTGEYFLYAPSQQDLVQLVDARACIACQRRLDPAEAPMSPADGPASPAAGP